MEPNKSQFKKFLPGSKAQVHQLNRYSKKLYPQVAEQLNLLIKQARLDKIKKL